MQLDAIKRLAYAVKYREINFLLSDAVTNDSRVLDHRTPRDRVQRVAPWLTLDGNAYPAVVDGRVQWILDGYTTSASYPYSETTTLDTRDRGRRHEHPHAVRAVQAGQVNYVRNSVKATVDAYDGTVTLYQWDEQDPVLKAWMSIFPGTVKPLSDIKGSLMAHLRYPEDLFKVQRKLLEKYHDTRSGVVLRRPELLARARRPDAAGRQPAPAAVLPLARDARPVEPGVLADVDVHADR